MTNVFLRPVRPLLAAALAAILGAAARAGAASPCGDPPPDPAALRSILFSPQAAPLDLSLSPDAACPDPDLSAWLAWFRAQALPGAMLPDLSALPAILSPSNSAYPVVARSPATLLRVADHLFDPASAVPPPAALRYDVYFLADTNDYPALHPAAPLFARAPDFTETLALSAARPGSLDVPLPSLLLPEDLPVAPMPQACAVRATLLPPPPAPPLPPVILPLFSAHRAHPVDAFADSGLSADTWKRLSDLSVAPLADLPADDSPAVLDPHPFVLSPAALDALANRPRLAQRLLLSAADISTPESAPAPLPGTPLTNRPSVLFSLPARDLPDRHYGYVPSLRVLDLDPGLPALPDPSPLRDAVPVFFLRAWLVCGLSALLLFAALLVLYRRPPPRRTAVWLVLPLLALLLALAALATRFLMPRNARARQVLLRVGAADFPEQYCYSSSSFILFRPAPLRFAYPSPAAAVNPNGLPSRVPLSIDRSPAATTLDIPPGLPVSPFSVDAAWFAPAQPPPLRAVPTPVPDAPPGAPPAPAPSSPEEYLNLALASRHVVADRDAADSWLYLAGDWYHLGPLHAGQTLFPTPDTRCARTNAPLSDWVETSDGTLVRRSHHGTRASTLVDERYLHGLPHFGDVPPADHPWVLLAREDAPALPDSPRSTSTTLWLTEFP